MRRSEIFRLEFRPLLRLAGPLVLAELGWMGMGIADTIMVGRLPASAEAIGAVSLGHVLFYAVALFGGGLLLGLDTLVSQAFGAGKIEDCHRSLVNGVFLGLVLAPVLMGVVWGLTPALQPFGIHPDILLDAVPYLNAINWSTLPLFLYFAFRRYLQGMNLVKPIMFSLVSANLVNLAANWALIFGHLGFPAMGVEGSGWATCISRIYMAGVLVGYAIYYDRTRHTGLFRVPWKPDVARLRRLVELGFPAALLWAAEISIFAITTALIARLDPVSLAAHQITLTAASFTFMVPLGISSAAAVRVGQAIGRGDPSAAGRAGWAALFLGASFMFCAALAFLLVPHYIVRIFTPSISVASIGVSLLAVAALFQLCDGLQIVATGALRGAGDTRTPLIVHVFAYWLIGLPLGYFLCFERGLGAVGLWSGLSTALILIGLTLLLVWSRKVKRLMPSPA